MSAIITDRCMDTHSMPDKWLGARVVGWMWSICDGLDWWACARTRTGEFLYSSSDGALVDVPDNDKREYARKVIHHLNRDCSHGGAWLAGWIGKYEFVLIWKDHDGDIQINNKCDVRWDEIREWDMEDWAEQCEQAYSVYAGMNEKMEWSQREQIKLSQGERPN